MAGPPSAKLNRWPVLVDVVEKVVWTAAPATRRPAPKNVWPLRCDAGAGIERDNFALLCLGRVMTPSIGFVAYGLIA